MRFVCKISLSLLETRENIFGFLFSSRNWRKCLKFLHFFGKNSRSLLEPENRSQHFSFLFSKLEMWIPYFSFSSPFDFLASRQCLYVNSVFKGTDGSDPFHPFCHYNFFKYETLPLMVRPYFPKKSYLQASTRSGIWKVHLARSSP